MNELYDQGLGNLRHEIETRGARPVVIDAAVHELMLLGDERLPGDLLSLLSDSAEFDEGMFSLIHAAESCSDSAYVSALLSVFPRLVSSAPRWASVLLMRVMNRSSAQSEMARQVRDVPTSVKEAVRGMCGRIEMVSPQFLSKTVPIVLAAS